MAMAELTGYMEPSAPPADYEHEAYEHKQVREAREGEAREGEPSELDEKVQSLIDQEPGQPGQDPQCQEPEPISPEELVAMAEHEMAVDAFYDTRIRESITNLSDVPRIQQKNRHAIIYTCVLTTTYLAFMSVDLLHHSYFYLIYLAPTGFFIAIACVVALVEKPISLGTVCILRVLQLIFIGFCVLQPGLSIALFVIVILTAELVMLRTPCICCKRTVGAANAL